MEESLQIYIEDIPFIWREYVQGDPLRLTVDAKALGEQMRKAIDECGLKPVAIAKRIFHHRKLSL